MQKKIHILGGGVAGSALAYFLSEYDFEVNLYEKRDHLGGLSRSVWIEKYKCWNDIGPHIFHSPDKEITNLWKDLFSDIFQYGDYYSAIIKGRDFKKYHPYPISKEGIQLVSNIDISKIDFDSVSLKDQAIAKNFKEMMIAKLGHELEKEYFRYYPEKLWGMSTDCMRADWAPKRISIKEKIDTFFSGQFVATGKKGAGQVYLEIEKLLNKKNCKLSFNSEIDGLKINKGKIQSFIFNQKEINTENDLVISTIPIPIIASLMGLEINLRYRGVKISNWITNERNLLPNNYGWIYFDDKKIPFTRITEYTKMSPESISSDRGIITAECPFDPYYKDFENDERKKHLQEVKTHLDSIPWLQGKIMACSSFFPEPFVYPIREQGFENILNVFNNKVSQIENFWTLGAAGGFEYSDSQILFRKAKDFSEDLISDLLNSTNRIIVKKEAIQKSDNLKSGYKLVDNQYLNQKTLIISEIGINHNGSIDLAKKLIEESKKAGADLVKFQLYKPEKRASDNIRDAFYCEKADGEGESLKELFQTCHLTIDELIELKIFSENVGIEMFLSAFDSESVLEAVKINPNLIKISSMDLTNIEVWEAASHHFKNIIASTGMSSLDEVRRSYQYSKSIKKEIDITLLHCVSSYPMPIGEANLGRIDLLREISPNVGYSDHSTTIEVPYTAALMGASVIEKHFTIDKSLKGPDHIHSATPDEMKWLVELIASKKEIMNTSKFDISKIQKAEMMKQKKGYFYADNFEKGHKLEKKDMRLGAPCIGSDTFTCYELLGKELIISVSKNQPIFIDHF